MIYVYIHSMKKSNYVYLHHWRLTQFLLEDTFIILAASTLWYSRLQSIIFIKILVSQGMFVAAVAEQNTLPFSAFCNKLVWCLCVTTFRGCKLYLNWFSLRMQLIKAQNQFLLKKKVTWGSAKAEHGLSNAKARWWLFDQILILC